MLHRAYAVLNVRSINDGERVIDGIATTPATDRMDDVVDPMGAKYALPMPLLWQHDSRQPIGQVFFAKPTKTGIPFKAQLASTAEPGTLKDRLDEAWQSIKLGLVRAVSIGFRDLAHEVLANGGWRFTEWEWLELSAVTIPANAEATITTIRSIDAKQLAATGRALQPRPETRPASRENPATPTGNPPNMKTLAERIAEYEAKRADLAGKIKAFDDVTALSGDEVKAYDELAGLLETCDNDLKRLRQQQKALEGAVAITGAVDPASGSRLRASQPAEAKAPAAKPGRAFTRYALALARSRGNLGDALGVVKGNLENGRWADTPQLETILRTAVAAGSTTDSSWALPLVPYNVMVSEFIELLRPATIIGKFGQNGIPALRRIPFDIKVQSTTSGSSVGWVGEAKPKPVGKMAFATTTLGHAKAAGIIVLTEELIRSSSPAAEDVVQNDLVAAMAQYLDQQFIDPDVAAVANVNPASLTHGVAAIPSTGTDAEHLLTDIGSAVAAMIAQNISPAGSVWIMSEIQAMRIGLMLTALGVPQFPGVNVNGGILGGLPIITSQNDGLVDGGSPAGGRIALVKASEVFLADDGEVMLDVSREASLQMNDAPDDPVSASTVMVSLWQQNMVGIRAERFINWATRRTGAVQWISDAAYK